MEIKIFSLLLSFLWSKMSNISDTLLLSHLMFHSNFCYIRGCREFINLWYCCLEFNTTRPYPCRESSTFASVHWQGRHMSHQQDETAQWEPKAAFPLFLLFSVGFQICFSSHYPWACILTDINIIFCTGQFGYLKTFCSHLLLELTEHSCLICSFIPLSVIKMRLQYYL